MADEYSIPQEAKQLLLQGIIDNPLHALAPDDIKAAASMIEYVGTHFPVIPINWRFAESISAIKGFQGAMLNVLLKEKYGLDFQKIVIDTYVHDTASTSLFLITDAHHFFVFCKRPCAALYYVNHFARHRSARGASKAQRSKVLSIFSEM